LDGRREAQKITPYTLHLTLYTLRFTPYASRYYLEPQVEQLVAEQPPQEELAVLLNFPPLEKAKADIIRWTFLPLHLGQAIFSEILNTNFSNSFLH
jgi:hypothetical protein